MQKTWTQNEEQRNVATIPGYSVDRRTTKHAELHRWRSGGLKLTSSTTNACEDKTAQHIGSYHSTKFGMSRPEPSKRTSRHRLHPLLRQGHKTRRGGILNTGKNLNSGESGNQKNGKTKSGGRNGKRRQQTIHVHTRIRKLIADVYCFNCCSSCLEFSNFLAVLHHSSSHLLFLQMSRPEHWQMS